MSIEVAGESPEFVRFASLSDKFKLDELIGLILSGLRMGTDELRDELVDRFEGKLSNESKDALGVETDDKRSDGLLGEYGELDGGLDGEMDGGLDGELGGDLDDELSDELDGDLSNE